MDKLGLIYDEDLGDYREMTPEELIWHYNLLDEELRGRLIEARAAREARC